MKTNLIYKIFSWVVVFLVPIILVLTAVRLLFNPFFLKFEYNLPGFPADLYGFTTQDRIHWAQYAMDYLMNSEGIDYLGDLQFADGSPLYNERELGHMIDVKNTVQSTLNVWYFSWIVLIGLGLWAWFGKWWNLFLLGLNRGGWITVIFIGSLVLFSIVAFGIFFTAFHNVFFQPGTWQFYWTDTLIRLFPQRFWQDIFLYVGGFSLLGGLALGFGLRRPARRNQSQ